MVQRKDIAFPFVIVALDCRQHDLWPVPTGLCWRLLRHELSFSGRRGYGLRTFRWRHLANAEWAIRTEDGIRPLCRLNLGVRANIGGNCDRKIVLQRFASDEPVSIQSAFGVSLKRLSQVVRPDAVHEGIAGVGLLVGGASEECGCMVGGLHQRFELRGREITDHVSRLFNTGFEIGCARVDEDEAFDALLLLEGLQEHLFQRDGCSGQIAGMGVPGGQTIGPVGVEAVTGIEEYESIAGRQLVDRVGEIIFERRPSSIGIEPKGYVLGGHSKVLNEDILHRSRISLGELDRADVLLLIGFDSDQDGMCHSHRNASPYALHMAISIF